MQENDRELLNFDPNAAGEDDDSDDEEAQEGGDDPMGEAHTPILTKTILRNWQKSLLEVRVLVLYYQNLGLMAILLAPFATGTPKTPDRFQVGSTHERGRASHSMEH